MNKSVSEVGCPETAGTVCATRNLKEKVVYFEIEILSLAIWSEVTLVSDLQETSMEEPKKVYRKNCTMAKHRMTTPLYCSMIAQGSRKTCSVCEGTMSGCDEPIHQKFKGLILRLEFYISLLPHSTKQQLSDHGVYLQRCYGTGIPDSFDQEC